MQIKAIELTGEEIKVEFERPYIFIEINNKNDSEILASINPNIVRGNDNVLIIKANSAGTLGDVGFPKIKEIYLSGTGKVEIIAKDFVTSSVNIYAKGGGISPTPPSPTIIPTPLIRYSYKDGLKTKTSGGLKTVLNTHVSMDELLSNYEKNEGMTLVFKFNTDELKPYEGLFGPYSITSFKNAGIQGCDVEAADENNILFSSYLMYHRFKLNAPTQEIYNKDTVFVIYDSPIEYGFFMNGKKLELEEQEAVGERTNDNYNMWFLAGYEDYNDKSYPRCFNGTVYDVILYNRALTEKEILEITDYLLNK